MFDNTQLHVCYFSYSCWGTHFLYLSNPPSVSFLPIIPGTGASLVTCHHSHIISPIPSEECDPREVWLGWMEAWQGLGDESCTLHHPAGPIGCVR